MLRRVIIVAELSEALGRPPLLFAWAVSFLVLSLSASAAPAPCDSLADLRLPNTTITAARIVAAGVFELPPDSPRSDSSFFTAFETLPAFCRVQGVVKPSTGSHIEFEVWLPASHWNGKYMGAGNGGFGGMINYFRLAEAVNAGYVGSATDTGHRGTVMQTDWIAGHPERVIDFGYRAIHETAEKTKVIIHALYGEGPSRSYFNGCSNGGRQALEEAQRYPADYDGILAGAPAFSLGRSFRVARELDATNPMLTAFKNRGGKLIMYHGANDGPRETVQYYQRVVRKMGKKSADEFLRLFVVPEMGHCGGGPVPDFGLRLEPQADPQHSMSAALEHWAENGVAPDSITATKYNADGDPGSGIIRTRPLCPYPQEPERTGMGSRDESANYCLQAASEAIVFRRVSSRWSSMACPIC